MAEIWNFETKTDCPSPFKLCSQQNRSSYFLHIPVVLLSVAISREQRIKHISYMNCRVTKNQNSLVRSAWYHRDISSTVSHSTRHEWLSELRIRLGSVCLCPLWPERRYTAHSGTEMCGYRAETGWGNFREQRMRTERLAEIKKTECTDEWMNNWLIDRQTGR